MVCVIVMCLLCLRFVLIGVALYCDVVICLLCCLCVVWFLILCCGSVCRYCIVLGRVVVLCWFGVVC